MEVHKNDIQSFISAGQMTFVIPVYQRNYDWKKENCLQLFADVLNLVGSEKTHFIGTICFKMNGRHECVVIDGQQRITSIMLLMKAIYDSSNDEDLKDKINDQFLENRHKHSDGGLKLKLKPIKKDEDVYKKLMGIERAFSSDAFTADEICSNTYRNYMLFKSLVDKAIAQGYDLTDIEDAAERLEIVEICLTDENPQVIFESLNSTGLGLTNTDLLRNYLLMSMDYKDQEELYHDYWMQIETMLGSSNMEQFLVDYLILKRKSNDLSSDGKKTKISSKNLYYAFKKQFPIEGNAKVEVEKRFGDMFKYANYYKHFLYTEETIYGKLDEVRKKLYELFYLLGEKNAAILVMFLYDKYSSGLISEEFFAELLKICISFSFRSKVCYGSGFSAQFSALTVQKLDVSEIDENFKSRFWNAITSGKGRYAFPKDVEFADSLVHSNIYQSLRSDGSKYLLYSLEMNREHSKELPSYNVGTVEHVLPQTLNEKWKEYLTENNDFDKCQKFIHTLGNLTLTNYNGQLSNNFFEQKKVEYEKSNYANTKALKDISSWTSSDIEKRGEELAEQAVKIWKLDSKYNKKASVESETTFTLQSDFASFMGMKPGTISFCGEEKQISNWSDFLALVADKLYEVDSNLFSELLLYKDLPGRKAVFAEKSDGMRRFHQIGDNLYMNTNNDAEMTLRIIKSIIGYFDEKTDSSYADDLWFTIRSKD